MKLLMIGAAALAFAVSLAGCDVPETGREDGEGGLVARAREAAAASGCGPSEGGELHVYTWADYISPTVVSAKCSPPTCKREARRLRTDRSQRPPPPRAHAQRALPRRPHVRFRTCRSRRARRRTQAPSLQFPSTDFSPNMLRYVFAYYTIIRRSADSDVRLADEDRQLVEELTHEVTDAL